MSITTNNTTVEKPLSGGARVLLVLGAAAVMLAFYVLSILAVLLLWALIGAEVILTVALARFAAARLMMPTLQKHIGLAALVVRSFRVRKGAEFRIPLGQQDAPALHKMLEGLCQRLALAVPQEIVLQMGDGAWVNLRGMRSGAGETTLGVGYDLLAGLSVAEMEAVLAHEMTHAKLIHRGFRNWLMAGQIRIRTLAMSLWAEISAARRARQSASVAHILFVGVDRLLRLCTRLTAAYSRQDEFEADRGAAELCGARVMKSALSKLESLHAVTSRLPWNERVAQLQQTGGYSQWLLQEIARGTAVSTADSSQVLSNKYSTHPLIRDRLAALPSDDQIPAPDSPSGIRLLANPDEIAVKLVTALQQVLAEQEQKDSQTLEKFTRKTGRRTSRALWLLGGAVVLAMVFGLCGSSGIGFADAFAVAASCCLVVILIGWVAFRYGKKRDRLDLAVPEYGQLTQPVKDRPAKEKIEEMQKAIAEELATRFGKERRHKALLLAGESYAALAVCDYLRAHVAARECLKYDKKSVEGALALAVACASFGQLPDTGRLLAFVQGRSGFNTFSTAWGAAWAGLLAGDWARAEAMLEKALKLQPQQTTLLSYLAIAQARRGKLQSCILNARRACEADPGSRQKVKYLIGRLLDGGYTREAQERMAEVRVELDSDVELMFSMTQLHLLQGSAPEASEWMARIKQSEASPQLLVRLGKLCETARLKDQAANLYLEALAADHYPEAHLGLGRLEIGPQDKTVARRHLLAALNVDRPVGKDGVTTWQILQPILAQMLSLHEPAPVCRAWIAAFPSQGQLAALAGQSFMVYAPDLPQAQAYFQTVMEALQPDKPPVALPANHWTAAPRPLQPEGPVRPGVQGIWH